VGATASPAARSGPPRPLESERVLLLTRTTPIEECARRTDGLTLFLAPLRDSAVTIRPIPKLGRNAVASCEVSYDALYVEGGRPGGGRRAGASATCSTG